MDRPIPSSLAADPTAGGLGTGDDRHRDSLFLMARIRTPQMREAIPVRVRNLSEGGVMAEWTMPLSVETPIEIEIRGIGWVPGRVAWLVDGRAGLAFDSPVDPRRARKPVGQGSTTPDFAKPAKSGKRH